MTIVEFVRARISEDLKAAEAAIEAVGTPWELHDGSLSVDSQPFGVGYGDGDLTALRHCLRHEPVQVLRECAFKLALLARYAEVRNDPNDECLTGEYLAGVLKPMAYSWRKHPDYNPDWMPAA